MTDARLSANLIFKQIEALMNAAKVGKRGAIVVPAEKYTPERKAEFLLSSATTARDYRQARKEVKKLGIDPDSIPHRRPK